MEETQQATTFELVKQRQVMKSMGESLNRTSFDKTRDISKWSNANLNNGETHSRSTDKERSVIGIRQAEIEAPIAFYAHLGRNNLEHAGIGQIVIYDSVVTNVGNGYSGSSGAFTAQVDGIYVFSSTLVALLHNNVRTSIFKNSDLINYMFAGGVESLLNSSSNTIVLQLNKGDVITVRIADGNSSMQGYESSSFSGFLLSRLSNNQNVIVGK
ncbi:Complement C1q-like protein 3 [Mactra antiquata]